MPTEKLISGHRRFREKFESEHEVFERLAEEGQRPEGAVDRVLGLAGGTGADHRRRPR